MSTSKRNFNLSIDATHPGYKLIWKIHEKCINENIPSKELAEIIGVSQTTISYIFTGRKDVRELDKQIYTKLAFWLEMPVLSVMMLAELIVPEDFYTSEKQNLTRAIDRAITLILADPEWGAFAPKEILGSNNEIKMYIIWCYEQATNTRLISGAVDYLDLIKNLAEFRENFSAAK